MNLKSLKSLKRDKTTLDEQLVYSLDGETL